MKIHVVIAKPNKFASTDDVINFYSEDTLSTAPTQQEVEALFSPELLDYKRVYWLGLVELDNSKGFLAAV